MRCPSCRSIVDAGASVTLLRCKVCNTKFAEEDALADDADVAAIGEVPPELTDPEGGLGIGMIPPDLVTDDTIAEPSVPDAPAAAAPAAPPAPEEAKKPPPPGAWGRRPTLAPMGSVAVPSGRAAATVPEGVPIPVKPPAATVLAAPAKPPAAVAAPPKADPAPVMSARSAATAPDVAAPPKAPAPAPAPPRVGHRASPTPPGAVLPPRPEVRPVMSGPAAATVPDAAPIPSSAAGVVPPPSGFGEDTVADDVPAAPPKKAPSLASPAPKSADVAAREAAARAAAKAEATREAAAKAAAAKEAEVKEKAAKEAAVKEAAAKVAAAKEAAAKEAAVKEAAAKEAAAKEAAAKVAAAKEAAVKEAAVKEAAAKEAAAKVAAARAAAAKDAAAKEAAAKEAAAKEAAAKEAAAKEAAAKVASAKEAAAKAAAATAAAREAAAKASAAKAAAQTAVAATDDVSGAFPSAPPLALDPANAAATAAKGVLGGKPPVKAQNPAFIDDTIPEPLAVPKIPSSDAKPAAALRASPSPAPSRPAGPPLGAAPSRPAGPPLGAVLLDEADENTLGDEELGVVAGRVDDGPAISDNDLFGGADSQAPSTPAPKNGSVFERTDPRQKMPELVDTGRAAARESVFEKTGGRIPSPAIEEPAPFDPTADTARGETDPGDVPLVSGTPLGPRAAVPEAARGPAAKSKAPLVFALAGVGGVFAAVVVIAAWFVLPTLRGGGEGTIATPYANVTPIPDASATPVETVAATPEPTPEATTEATGEETPAATPTPVRTVVAVRTPKPTPRPPKLTQQDLDFMLAKADVLAAEGKLPEARAQYLKIIQASPTWGAPHYGLGNVLERQKDLPRACKEWRKFLELSPAARGSVQAGKKLSTCK